MVTEHYELIIKTMVETKPYSNEPISHVEWTHHLIDRKVEAMPIILWLVTCFIFPSDFDITQPDSHTSVKLFDESTEDSKSKFKQLVWMCIGLLDLEFQEIWERYPKEQKESKVQAIIRVGKFDVACMFLTHAKVLSRHDVANQF